MAYNLQCPANKRPKHKALFNTNLPPSQEDMNAMHDFVRNLDCTTNVGDVPT